MYKIIITILFLFNSLLSPSSDIRSEVEGHIKNYFGSETRLEFINYEIPEEIRKNVEKKSGQKFFKDFIYLWKVYSGEDYIATALIDNVYGKSQPITFMVLLNRNCEVLLSEIIKYREPYGGQISNKNWLKQFNGKDFSSSYKIGEDISAISGATISVSSITKGIRKITMLINLIGKDL
ncbi:MAG: FMN-binding protein [Melioribacteraceae bacterium]|nr:FMN-binding protein [Melioribacteraceae bacterium]